MSNTTAKNILTVSTVAAATASKGRIPILAATRESKNRKNIPDTEKRRYLEIPEWDLSAVPDKFRGIVLQALTATAKTQLAALWEEHGNQWRETDAELWTLDSLLAFAEAEAISKRLTSAGILADLAEFIEGFPEQRRAKLAAILSSMAATAKKGQIIETSSLIPKLTQWLATNDPDEDLHSGQGALRALKKYHQELVAQAQENAEAF